MRVLDHPQQHFLQILATVAVFAHVCAVPFENEHVTAAGAHSPDAVDPSKAHAGHVLIHCVEEHSIRKAQFLQRRSVEAAKDVCQDFGGAEEILKTYCL